MFLYLLKFHNYPSQVLAGIHLHMSTLADFIQSLLLAGKGAKMSKKDLDEAFSTVPVHQSQYPKQSILALGCVFYLLKNSYGDKQVSTD